VETVSLFLAASQEPGKLLADQAILWFKVFSPVKSDGRGRNPFNPGISENRAPPRD